MKSWKASLTELSYQIKIKTISIEIFLEFNFILFHLSDYEFDGN